MTFPIVSVEDMLAGQFMLLDHLGIGKLYGCIGSSQRVNSILAIRIDCILAGNLRLGGSKL